MRSGGSNEEPRRGTFQAAVHDSSRSESSNRESLVVSLAQSFSDRHRRGERPTIDEYVALRPELEVEIRELFPMLCVLEKLGPAKPDPGTIEPGPDLEPLKRLGEYRIIRELGRGGMGVVYEAEQETLRRRVAIKVLPFQSFQDQRQLERFRVEAQAAARLHHTNIVPVFGVGEERGVHYYVMQFIRGQTLAEVLQEVRRLRAAAEPPAADDRAAASVARTLFCEEASEVAPPPVEPQTSATSKDPAADSTTSLGKDPRSVYCRSAARIAMQVAEGLAYAHNEGILHRDIKPSNLLLDLKGTVWITDFGLAKLQDSAELTATGGLVGTWRYMAPERFTGAGDARSDVYGLGITLYELLTLRPAFASSDRAELMRDITQSTPPAPRRLDPVIPRDLETVVLKATAKEPKDRYASVSALADDLRRFINHEPVSARRASAPERLWRWSQRNRVLAALSLVIAALLVTLAAGSLVSAVNLRHERDRTFERLVASKLEEGRARRLGRKSGARALSLAALHEAATPENAQEVRNEVIASLALLDLEVDFSRDVAFKYALADADLTRIAVLADDGEVTVYAGLQGPEPIVNLRWDGRQAEDLWLSPDGRYVATAHGDWLAVWDVDTGSRLLEEAMPRGYRAVAFDAPARRCAHGESGGGIVVRSLPGGEVVQRLEEKPGLGYLAFDPSGQRLAAAACGRNRNAVLVFDLPSGKVVARLFHPHITTRLAWHPDGRRLAVGCWDYNVHVWDVETGKRLQCLAGNTAETVRVAYSHGGGLLAATSWANQTLVWDTDSGEFLAEAAGNFLAFAADDRQIGFVHRGNQIGVWSLRGGEAFHILHAPQAGKGPTDVDISPDGRWLAAASSEEGARIWCLEPLGEAHRVEASNVWCVRFHPDGSALWTGANQGLYRWPLRQVRENEWSLGPPVEVAKSAPKHISLTRDGRWVAMVLADRLRIDMLDLEAGGTVQASLPHPGVSTCQFSPSGRWLVSATYQGRDVRVWDSSLFTPVHAFEIGTAHARFSPDERWLAIGNGPCVVLYETGTWQERVKIPRYDAGELGSPLAFTADGRRLALARSRSLLTLNDVATGAELARFEAPMRTMDLRVLAFSPDEGQLIAVMTQVLQVWDLRAIRGALSTIDLDWSPGKAIPRPWGGEALQDLRIDCGGLLPGSPNAVERQAQASRLIEILTRRIELDPSPEAHAARAAALERLGEGDAALADADRVLEASPDDQPALAQRRRILARRRARAETNLGPQGLDAAWEAWKEIVALSPDDVEAGNNLPWIWITRRARGLATEAAEDDLALRVAERAHAAQADSAVAKRNLGAVYFHLGRLEEAKPLLEEAWRLDRRLNSAALYLAVIEHRAGRTEEGRRYFHLASTEGGRALAPGSALQVTFEYLRRFAAGVLGLAGEPAEPGAEP